MKPIQQVPSKMFNFQLWQTMSVCDRLLKSNLHRVSWGRWGWRFSVRNKSLNFADNFNRKITNYVLGGGECCNRSLIIWNSVQTTVQIMFKFCAFSYSLYRVIWRVNNCSEVGVLFVSIKSITYFFNATSFDLIISVFLWY